MSLEDLKAQGLLLPEKVWSVLDLHSSVNKPALLLTFALAILAVTLIVTGDGHAVTWIGALLFVVSLLLFTLVSNTGVVRQVRRLESAFAEESEPEAEKGNGV